MSFCSIDASIDACSLKEAAAVLQEVREVFLILTKKKLFSPSPPNTKLLHLVISLIFYINVTVEHFTDANTIKVEELTEKMWEILGKSIAEDWIGRNFTDEFGAPRSGKFQNVEKDMQVSG
jgi:hypothetical protein